MILKTITFNMCHGEGLDGKIDVRRQACFLEKYKPDIIFLQEIDVYTKRSYNKNQIYTFSKYSNLKYRAMGTNIKYKNGFYGDGILSRFPIEYSANYLAPITNANHEQRGILCTKILFGTAAINLYSVHYSTFEEERILASKEILRVTSKLNRHEHVIIAGDFNVGIKKIGHHQYTQIKQDNYPEYNILKSKFDHLGNTEDTWFAENISSCIDTMFFSKDLKLKKYETLKSDISDHYAIYAEFIV